MVKVLGNKTFLDENKLTRMIILSGLVHFLAIFLFVFLPNFTSNHAIRVIPQYTPVALIGPGELGGGGGQSAAKSVTVPKAKVNVSSKKPELIKSKIEPKAISIDKTQSKTKIEPKTAASAKQETNSRANDHSVEDAMNRIRERVGGESQEETTPGNGTGGAGGGVGVGVASGGGGASGAPEMLVYMSIVVDRIMEAWFLPPLLKEQAIKQGLLTIIDIRIARDGKVTFQGIEKPSGNAVYDDSTRKAIQKMEVNSFPPLPAVYQGDYLDLGIKFNPSEVNS